MSDCYYQSTYGNDFGFYLMKCEIDIDWFNVSYISTSKQNNVEVTRKGYSFSGSIQ